MLAVLRQSTPATVLDQNLEKIRNAAEAAERDGYAEHAAALRKHLDLLARFREAGAIDAAIVEAISLGAASERLRADALLASPIDSYKRGRPKVTVSDDAIRDAFEKHRLLKNGAIAVRLSEKQFSERCKRLGLKKRKSVRLPMR